jgi:hypothetical protein
VKEEEVIEEEKAKSPVNKNRNWEWNKKISEPRE